MKNQNQNPTCPTQAMVENLIEQNCLRETFSSFVEKAISQRYAHLQKRGKKRKEVATLLQEGVPIMEVVARTGACYRTVKAVQANITK